MKREPLSGNRYLIRAVKYFFYFAAIFALVLAILLLTGLAKGSPSELFRDGWRSVGQIAVLFAFVAALYPKLGFVRRYVSGNGQDEEQLRRIVLDVMEGRGYRLEREADGILSFRLRNTLNAVSRMLEDRITMAVSPAGVELEGLTKDVVRVIGSLEMRLRKDNGTDQ